MEPTELKTPPPIHDAVPPTEGTPPPESTGEAGLPRFLVLWAIVVALAAGVLAWAGGEATYDFYRPSKEAAAEPYAFKQLNQERDIADGRNAAIAYGMLGAAVGLGLGAAAGLSRRSTRGAVSGGLAGLILGGIAPALIAPWVVPLHRKWYWPETPDLKLPIMVHGTMWCALGAAAGLAFGIGLGNRRWLPRTVVGGLIGAALATILFHALGAILFPYSRADLPIAETQGVRLLSRLLVAVGVAIGVAWSVRETRRKPSPVSELPTS